MKLDTRKITGTAMVSAIAYAVMLMGFHFVPAANYLKYEAKEVILTIGGFIYGPVAALAAAFIVAFAEMVTVSTTQFWGFIMNFFGAATFGGIASFVYKKARTAKGAVVALTLGSLAFTIVMLLLNYVVVPIYTGVSREIIAGMLLPMYLPFNLVKAGLNSAFVLLLYKPLMTALRAARLLPADSGGPIDAGQRTGGSGFKLKINMGLLLCAVLLLVVCACVIYFVFNK